MTQELQSVFHSTFDSANNYWGNKKKKCLKELLDYAIKIAATWVACKKLHVMKIHAIKIQTRRVEIIALACNFPGNFSCATRKFLTKLHSLKAPLGAG